MNTQEAIILMKRMEAAWPQIFSRNKEREALYIDQLTPYDYMKASTAINQMVTSMKHPPTIADLNEALKPHVEFSPQYRDYGPGRTSENKPVASMSEAIAAFTKGLKRSQPGWTQQKIDEQIQIMFPKSKAEIF